MSWLQIFLVVLVALVWATAVTYVVLTRGDYGIVALITPPVMLVFGAAVGLPLRRVAEALKNGNGNGRES